MPLDETAAALLLHPLDDVAVARRRIAKGDPTGLAGLTANALIPRGHKVAVRGIPAGTALRKFGQVIGVATKAPEVQMQDTGQPYQESAQEAEYRELTGVVLADTEDVWRDLFGRYGRRYRDPTLVLFSGGVRSACTYVGARRLRELSKRTTFVRVTQQLNEVFGK